MEKEKIKRLIRSLGIHATYRGYNYTVSAVLLALEDEDALLFISKTIYPAVAKMYQTNTSAVERNIRTVINVCWERGNRDK